MNKLFIILCIILIVLWTSSTSESFDITTPSVLQGYNNILLTDPSGNMSSVQFPKGMIILWNGSESNIPQGWAICDGTNGTPDLRGRVAVGLNPDSNKEGSLSIRRLGEKGGEETHLLTIDEMPKHDHATWTRPHVPNTCDGGSCGFAKEASSLEQEGNRKTAMTGNDKPHNNMPPFTVLTYIMKIV